MKSYKKKKIGMNAMNTLYVIYKAYRVHGHDVFRSKIRSKNHVQMKTNFSQSLVAFSYLNSHTKIIKRDRQIISKSTFFFWKIMSKRFIKRVEKIQNVSCVSFSVHERRTISIFLVWFYFSKNNNYFYCDYRIQYSLIIYSM